MGIQRGLGNKQEGKRTLKDYNIPEIESTLKVNNLRSIVIRLTLSL